MMIGPLQLAQYGGGMSVRRTDVGDALAKWEGFPVSREPRPIVLTGLSGMVMDRLMADVQWRAMFDDPAVAEVELPPELVPAAIDYCRNVHTGEQRPLTRIIRGNGPFGTDRGLRELPAWMMWPEDHRWPFIALDPQFERQMTWWPPGLRAYGPQEESTLAPDGRTLTYRFIGTPSRYAAYPHAEVFESETAVLVEPVEVPLDRPGGPRARNMERREVVVCLAAPLGNRVLIWLAHGAGYDTCGSPRTVITSAQLS
jgi:hypothetical protein